MTPAALAQAPLGGTLNLTGSATFGAGAIDFQPPAGGGTGAFLVDLYAQTGSFTAVAGTTGTIRDLGGAGASFLVFAAQPGWSFTLGTIGPGTFGSASCTVVPVAGQECTPPTGLPYNFVNLSSGTGLSSTLSIRFAGTAQNPAGSDFSGILTAQFPVPYQNVLAAMSGGGTVAASWSAEFTVVPQVAPQ